MNKKAQTLIISLWVLLILTVITIGIGQRVSMALRLSRYQRDRLEGIYLAKAGVNRAIAELENDITNTTTTFDAPSEDWANSEKKFAKIIPDENEEGKFATVSHTEIENNQENIIFGVVDEERKININTDSSELLIALLEKGNVASAVEVAKNILIWRGKIPDTDKIYDELGYPRKGDNFTNIEELTLVKGITLEDFIKIKPLITVYGDDKINANTASKEILTILANSLARNDERSCAEAVVDDIIKQREEKAYFKNITDIEARDVVSGTSADENLYANLKNHLTVQSENFFIEVTGNAGKIKCKVTAVYNRKDKKILYWHES